MATRIKCLIEYEGTGYAGFQIQPHELTVQQVLETSLSEVLAHPVKVISASRTDAGVHARGQVIAFDADLAIPIERFSKVVNHRLPNDIRVLNCEEVAATFHPRYDAHGKIYRYIIYRQLEGSVFWFNRAWLYHNPLDYDLLQAAAERMIGTHDMSCFCAAGSEVKDKVRTIEECYWQDQDPLLTLTVSGNGFLYHQVRNMVGTMIEIGRGFWEPEYINQLLASGDRTQAGRTAPAAGLYLEKVIY